MFGTASRPIRILLVADSHLGFDHPVRPRVRRRRRGEDFLANHRRACRTAVEEGVDLLVHGGDLFHAPNPPASLVYQAFDPLKRVADAGIPVFIVPGNHERSRIPFDWLGDHPDVHVFHEPSTVSVGVRGAAVAVTGLPCIRRGARDRFATELRRARRRESTADLRLLLTHQAFEGAVVGPADYTFRDGHDVIPLAAVPEDVAAVLSGHIHRHQVLERDLAGHPAPAPVIYPGSVERTAFAERFEPKGYCLLEARPGDDGGSIERREFLDVGARPMEIRPLAVGGLDRAGLERAIRRAVASAPRDAVIRLEADEEPEPGAAAILGAASLRALAPQTMNLEVRIAGARAWRGRRGRRPHPADRNPPQRELFRDP
ncbi:MAG: DNA repair exonuclease [Gemmatimonadota bacterium]|nr:DNA repair exonuclease [Gemmatimonadota bacterium]